MKEVLKNIYTPPCCHGEHCHPELDEGHHSSLLTYNSSLNTPFNEDDYIKLINEFYNKKKFDANKTKWRTAQYAQQLFEAVQQGTHVELKLDAPDTEWLAQLAHNTWQFSAAKNYQELRDIGSKLFDDKGNIVPYSRFKELALKVGDESHRHLRTEYDTALNGSQMAAKYKRFQATKDKFPYIEFDPVIDDHTTDLCRSLDGVVVPIDDPYVDMYWPPNHFNCRLNVKQRWDGPVTPVDKRPHLNIPPMFKVNLAKDNLVFPPGHPYYDGIPRDKLSNEATGFIEPGYATLIDYPAGNRLRIHEKENLGNPLVTNRTFAERLAGKGINVDLLPEVHAQNQLARKWFFPEIYETHNTCPDSRLNGALADFKVITEMGDKTVRNQVRLSSRQGAEIAVISLELVEYDLEKILQTLHGYFYQNKNTPLKEVWFMINEKDVIPVQVKKLIEGNIAQILSQPLL